MNRFQKVLVCFAVLLSFSHCVLAAEVFSVQRNYMTVLLDSGETGQIEAYNIENNNYCKLRDIAQLLKNTTNEFDVFYDSESGNVVITTGIQYSASSENQYSYFYESKAQKTTANLMIDEKTVTLDAYNIDGNNCFKLREIGELLNFEVKWNEERNFVQIDTATPEGVTRKETSLLVQNDFFSAYDSVPYQAYTGDYAHGEKSYLFQNKSGTLSLLVVGKDGKILVENFDRDYNSLGMKEIKAELPLFGGFYSGTDFHYILFGQSNKEEESRKEVYRIVKYTKDFEKVSDLSLNATDTFSTVPFDAGCTRMVENGSQLAIYSSRTRLRTEDGLNHQSNILFCIDTENMKNLTDTSRFPSYHVSHSFNQFVLGDDSGYVLLDHGDAYPRSVVIQKMKAPRGKTENTETKEADVLTISGKIGDNSTGVTLGGFEAGKRNYITLGTSIDQKTGKMEDIQNLFLGITDKKTLKSELKWITSYRNKDGFSISGCRLIPIGDSEFLVLWQEKEEEVTRLRYCKIDETGDRLTEITTLDRWNLYNTEPIYHNGKVTWVRIYNGKVWFYDLNID